MIDAFHSAGLGLAAGSEKLAVVSRNMANLNTTGYRAQEVDFADTLYRVSAQEGGGQVTVGAGVRTAGVVLQTGVGAPKQTGRALDFMVKGDGYFCVQGTDGLAYTRAGGFTTSEDGWLATPTGEYVLDADHGYIAVGDDEGAREPSEIAREIGVFTFTNPLGLTEAGGGLQKESPASGAAFSAPETAVLQGWLEGSGVDLAGEMSKMICAQRSFQANARMIKAADEVEETANALRA